jgi:hypothetical protein
MAEQKDVPTGPKGGVRVTDDDSRTVRSTQNVDPRDNTPTADQHEAQRRANDPQVDKQGHKSYGLVRCFSTASTLSRLARLLPSRAKRLTS